MLVVVDAVVLAALLVVDDAVVLVALLVVGEAVVLVALLVVADPPPQALTDESVISRKKSGINERKATYSHSNPRWHC